MQHFSFILFIFLCSIFQVNGQSKLNTFFLPKRDTLLAKKIENIRPVIRKTDTHPADDLYEQNWSTTNINYSFAKLKATKDTLRFTLSPYTFTCPFKGKVISAYRTPRRPRHTGTDIKLYRGDTVHCAFEGQVRLAKRVRGYGLMVLVRHYNGMETLYAHLSKISVKQNQYIKEGDLVGLGGRTGRATTEHLHFEIRILGKPCNSEKVINFEKGTLVRKTFYYHNAHIEYHPEDFKKNIPKNCIVSGDNIHYYIKKGDTLTSIAHQFGTTIHNICVWNNISSQKILQIGGHLVLKQ